LFGSLKKKPKEGRIARISSFRKSEKGEMYGRDKTEARIVDRIQTHFP